MSHSFEISHTLLKFIPIGKAENRDHLSSGMEKLSQSIWRMELQGLYGRMDQCLYLCIASKVYEKTRWFSYRVEEK